MSAAVFWCAHQRSRVYLRVWCQCLRGKRIECRPCCCVIAETFHCGQRGYFTIKIARKNPRFCLDPHFMRS